MQYDFWDESPWKQLVYSQNPQEVAATVASGGLVVGANNQRYGLLLSLANFSTAIQISLVGGTVGTDRGITIPAFGYIYLSSYTHGPLAGAAWYNGSVSATTFYIYQLIAESWPEEGDSVTDNIDHPPPPQTPIILPTAPGVQGQQGVVSYWKSLLSKVKGS